MEKDDLRIQFSREELIDLSRKWLRENYPADDKDEWMTRFGLMVDFITDLFEPNGRS